MIVITPITSFVREGKRVRAANLLCTEPGADGRAALVAFAASIHMKAEWLVNKATVYEHFSLQNARIERAITAGAQPIDKHRLTSILKRKRELLGLTKVPKNVLRARADVRDMRAIKSQNTQEHCHE